MANDVYEALLEVQKAGIDGIVFDSTNPHFKNQYISLGKLVDKVKPVLNEAGVVIIQTPDASGPSPALTTSLVHVDSGTGVTGTCPLILQKNDPQGVGSAITYMRRYALLSMLGLVADEDDDAESASGTEREVVNADKGSGKTKPLF